MADSVLTGRNILVTGGTGAAGQAIARRALDDGARRVVIYSRSESKQAEMKAASSDDRLRFFIGDVRDQQRLTQAMRDVEIVIHSAALKRVEVAEADPVEAKKTNVDGTEAVALAAIASGVRKAVLLSTDKAVAANTLYGASKFMAERLWTGMNVYGRSAGTCLASTRYGNVCGSTGSVVPLWRAQAAAGLPLSLTDVRMTRFLMHMRQAVDLIVLALSEMSTGGEVFVPKIGGARMTDLARAVSPFSPVRHVGIRPGEKLHETLIGEDEARQTYDRGGFYVIQPAARTWCAYADEPGMLVPDGFVCRSDEGPKLTVDELRELIQ